MTPSKTLNCIGFTLITHTAIHTLPLCYKPLGTLQGVTKSQKVHISSRDKYYILSYI